MNWLTLGQMVKVHGHNKGDQIAVKDIRTARTYTELDKSTDKLAWLLSEEYGLVRGDKFAVLMNNSVELVELFIAASKTGLIIVPINFRLDYESIAYILVNSGVKVFFYESKFLSIIDRLKKEEKFDSKLTIHEIFIGYNFRADDRDYPVLDMDSNDIWILLYTSGTTGRPKGVLRSYGSYIALFLTHQIEFDFTEQDHGLILMPLAHINSTFYGFIFIYIGSFCYIHREYRFDAVDLLEVIASEKITFISMIPTHYSRILCLPDKIKLKYDTSSIHALLTSSAPVCKEKKLAILDFFKGVKLYEAYGSTEAGTVTILKHVDQLIKIGSVGKECYGSFPVKILDQQGKPVANGAIGEIYSKSPMLFSGYYGCPQESRIDGYFSSGDYGYLDEDGFLFIVDRKDNMIISGGEHVFPSEVEKILVSHPDVLEAAVIGTPDKTWGEVVTAFVVLKEGTSLTAKAVIDHYTDRIAGFKKPKRVIFCDSGKIPRTGSDKIMHRQLRERWLKEHEKGVINS